MSNNLALKRQKRLQDDTINFIHCLYLMLVRRLVLAKGNVALLRLRIFAVYIQRLLDLPVHGVINVNL